MADEYKTNEDGVTVETKTPVILIILLLLSLAANLYFGYQWYSQNYKGTVSYKTLNLQLKEALSTTELDRDSLQNALNNVNQQMMDVLTQNETLNADNQRYISELETKTVKIRRLINSGGGNPNALVAAKQEIENLKKELVEKRIEVDGLMGKNQAFVQANKENEQRIDALVNENQKVEKKKKVLETRLKDASLQISDLVASPQRDRRGKLEDTDKSNRTSMVNVTFVLMETNLVEPGAKTLDLRLLGTSGEVLGTNNDLLTSSDKLISMRQEVQFDGGSQKVKFKFKQKELYKKGSYTAEIWSDGKLIDRVPFNLD
jgi:predicted  nucleic acid-binding Zn-ribbon protein